jgi:hypothetical protein
MDSDLIPFRVNSVRGDHLMWHPRDVKKWIASTCIRHISFKALAGFRRGQAAAALPRSVMNARRLK